MKKQLPVSYLILIIPLALILLAMSGGSPGGRSGSPGDSNINCTACHTGTPQQVSGWISADIPTEGYLPGQAYTVTLTATDASALRFGFELTAENSDGDKIGTFTITNETETQLVNSNNAVTHTNQGFTPSDNSKSWSFEWTAPEDPEASIFFYAAVNAADGNGNTAGDLIYLTHEEYNVNTTSVDLNAGNKFNIYPNPSQNNINISLSEIDLNTEIKVYNSSGQLILVTKAESLVTNIDVSAFSKGVYYVRINNYPPQKVIIY